jgi:hypothetical protein
MPALLDVLRGRVRERELHAVDHVAEAARAAAAGKTYDVAALESALDAQKMTIADFEKAVETARRRALWLSQVDGLAAASSRGRKLEATIRAEQEKFEEYRLSIMNKLAKVREELDLVNKNRNAGETARAELLNPDAVPGTVGIRYREAVASRDSARESVSNSTRALADVRRRLDVQQGLVQEILDNAKKEILSPHLAAERQEKLDQRQEAIATLKRRASDAEKALAAAEKDLAAAEAAVKAMEIEVLNT